jgi:hypothetical protein
LNRFELRWSAARSFAVRLTGADAVYIHSTFNRVYEAEMKLSRFLVVLTAFWFVTGNASPVLSADAQIAQGKKGKGTSKGKGSEKAEEVIQEKEDRFQGQENALDRGEGEKTGLIRQSEEDAKTKKSGKAKKTK